MGGFAICIHLPSQKTEQLHPFLLEIYWNLPELPNKRPCFLWIVSWSKLARDWCWASWRSATWASASRGIHRSLRWFPAKLVNITPITMVYGTYKHITIVNGVYKPSYNWGAPHCGMCFSSRLFFSTQKRWCLLFCLSLWPRCNEITQAEIPLCSKYILRRCVGLINQPEILSHKVFGAVKILENSGNH